MLMLIAGMGGASRRQGTHMSMAVSLSLSDLWHPTCLAMEPTASHSEFSGLWCCCLQKGLLLISQDVISLCEITCVSLEGWHTVGTPYTLFFKLKSGVYLDLMSDF